MLEGVGGQLDRGGAEVGEQRGQGDVVAPGDEPADSGRHRPGLGGVVAQQGDGGATGAAEGVGDHRGEHAARSQFHEGGGASSFGGGDAVGEAHGSPRVVGPVVGGGHLVGGEGGGGAVGQHRDRRFAGRGAGDDGAELVEDRFHERRVERVGHPQFPCPGAAPRPAGGEGPHLGGLTGDHHGGGAVDGGDADGGARHLHRHLGLGGGDGDHRPAGGQRRHEAGPGGHDAAGVGQVPHPGDVGGGEFADRVPDQDVGADAPGLQQPEEGDLDGEQRRLGVAGVVEPAVVDTGEHQVGQRGGRPQMAVQFGADLVEGLGVAGVGGAQLASHAGVLRALPGEGEGDTAAVAVLPGVRRQGPQFVEPTGDDDAVREQRAAGGQGQADVGRAELGVGGEEVRQGPRLGEQGRGVGG